MDLFFQNSKTKKLFSGEKELRAKFGQMSKAIMRRLAQLEAAETLFSLHRDMPGLRIHEYPGSENRIVSVDLTGNYRLLFAPTEPWPLKPDGGLDWKQITAITILEVIDPHK